MPDHDSRLRPDRVAGCLLGGAIGDALGAPLEAMTLDAIRERYGPEGFTDLALIEQSGGAGDTLKTSEETQLALLTAYGLLQGSVRARARGIGGATLGIIQGFYLGWAKRMGYVEEEGSGPGAIPGSVPLGAALPSEWSQAGRSTVEALRKAAARGRPGWVLGTPEEPINSSKGSGGVVRAAACGTAHSLKAAFDMGCRTAALTHGGPGGYLPAGTLAATVWALLRGAGLETALDAARAELDGHRGRRETEKALDAAVRLAAEGDPSPERVESLGGGWTGPEALAIAVYAALAAERLYAEGRTSQTWARQWRTAGEPGLSLAVNHSGDSDATGALCGNLIGARYGTHGFPGLWQVELADRRAVLDLAADLALELGPHPPVDPRWGEPPMSWAKRYPYA
ncbi:ADP-ribosylglycohydrolase family protein [Nocardiopsis composta]|uniref:ADP-ribosylglycohydrolase n=1 Tax=Nocardiopsis composta TaxID=157465 RepID=A0A7W8VBM8_9ACTN|nr:ADP-ribosylglycohydrolase family protein [Nocardiopsis composta]MBB5430075.1 ADP-ribosylglycohydrolase [Nocardiopsis composta]